MYSTHVWCVYTPDAHIKWCPARNASCCQQNPFLSPPSKESLYVLKAGLIQGNNLAIDQCTTSLMAFGVFSAYLMMGGAFTPKVVFTPLSLFQFVQRNVVRFFVRGVFQITEARVAVVRIQVGTMATQARCIKQWRMYVFSPIRNCWN